MKRYQKILLSLEHVSPAPEMESFWVSLSNFTGVTRIPHSHYWLFLAYQDTPGPLCLDTASLRVVSSHVPGFNWNRVELNQIVLRLQIPHPNVPETYKSHESIGNPAASLVAHVDDLIGVKNRLQQNAVCFFPFSCNLPLVGFCGIFGSLKK